MKKALKLECGTEVIHSKNKCYHSLQIIQPGGDTTIADVVYDEHCNIINAEINIYLKTLPEVIRFLQEIQEDEKRRTETPEEVK